MPKLGTGQQTLQAAQCRRVNARSPRTVFLTLLGLLVLAGLDQTLLSAALPGVARQLHGESLQVWAFAVYLLAALMALPLHAALLPRCGLQALLRVAILTSALGAAAAAGAHSMAWLVGARGLHGLGSGALMLLAQLVVHSRPAAAEQRQRLSGLLGLAYGVAVMAGPQLGAHLADASRWRWAFAVQVPLLLLAIPLLGREAPRQPLQGLADPPPCRLLLSLRLGLAGIGGVALYVPLVFLPRHLQGSWQLGAAGSARQLLPMLLGLLLGAVAARRRLRAGAAGRRLAVVALVLQAMGLLGAAALLALAAPQPLALGGALAVLGLGLGMLAPAGLALDPHATDSPDLRWHLAGPQMARLFGGALGLVTLSRAVQHGQLPGAFVLAGSLAVLGAVLAARLGRP